MAGTNSGVLLVETLKKSTTMLAIKILGGGAPEGSDTADTKWRNMGYRKVTDVYIDGEEEYEENGEYSPGAIDFETFGGKLIIETQLMEASEENWDLKVISFGRNPNYYTTARGLAWTGSEQNLEVEVKLVILPRGGTGTDLTSVPSCECIQIGKATVSAGQFKVSGKSPKENERHYVPLKIVAKDDPDDDFRNFLYNVLTANLGVEAADRRFCNNGAAGPFTDITVS